MHLLSTDRTAKINSGGSVSESAKLIENSFNAKPTMEPFPSHVLSCAPTMALILRAQTGQLPNSSYDDAWDAILTAGHAYSPSAEVEGWMRQNWTPFTAGGQAGENEITPDYPVPHARAWMQPFLDKFVATGGNATKAAAHAGVHERTPYKAREVDTDFAMAWTWAERKIADEINEELHRRGIEGWEEPVYGTLGGKFAGEGLVGSVRKFDSAVLLKMASARVPEYRSLVKEGAAQLTANALASSSAKSETSVVVSKEQLEKRQARQRKKLQHQVDQARLALGSTGTS